MPHTKPIATVDIVMFTLLNKRLHVLLVKREKEPFADMLALPGGYFHTDEDPDELAAARRTLTAKTGVEAPYLEQLCTVGGPDRDPRGWSLSVAHYAVVGEDVLASANMDRVCLVPADEAPQLAFDHNKILDFALQRLRDKSSYSTLPFYLLPEQFTLPEVQATYQYVMGSTHNKKSFRRWLDGFDMLEKLPGQFRKGKGRPAELFQLRAEKALLLRSKSV